MGLGDDETMNVMVMVTDDVLVEGTESYILSISVSSGPASIGAMNTITVNIADNDGEVLRYNCVNLSGVTVTLK